MVKSQKQLDRTFSALADPTRRNILRRLRGGPLSVGELAEPFEMSMAAVSKHLNVLEEAKLIRRTRSGRNIVISLQAIPLYVAASWLSGYRESWNSSLDRLKRLVEPKRRHQK